MDCFASLAMTAQHLDCLWLFEIRKPSLRGAKRRSNPSFFTRRDGLLRGACHRARIRATRWLAMTVQHLNCLCCLKLDCRHCEERSDEAIHSSFTRRDGLLRGACHRARICATRWLAMTAQHLDCLWLCEIRKPSLRGAKRRSNPCFLYAARWIASRSLSSGAHSRDPALSHTVFTKLRVSA